MNSNTRSDLQTFITSVQNLAHAMSSVVGIAALRELEAAAEQLKSQLDTDNSMNDQELQLALAKMLPEQIKHAKLWNGIRQQEVHSFIWIETHTHILDTEWLHVCWLVEQRLSQIEYEKWGQTLCDAAEQNQDTKTRQARDIASASWQQRAEAILRVKGV